MTEIWKLHHSSTGAIVFSRLNCNWDHEPLKKIIFWFDIRAAVSQSVTKCHKLIQNASLLLLLSNQQFKLKDTLLTIKDDKKTQEIFKCKKLEQATDWHFAQKHYINNQPRKNNSEKLVFFHLTNWITNSWSSIWHNLISLVWQVIH